MPPFSRLDLDPGSGGMMTGVRQVTCHKEAHGSPSSPGVPSVVASLRSPSGVRPSLPCPVCVCGGGADFTILFYCFFLKCVC